MRLVARYEKKDDLRYISHLDLMRLIQRTLRRASIPIAYSKGFNPHPRLSFASALSVGMTSQDEYMDILLETSIDSEVFLESMKSKLPSGIILHGAIKASNDLPSLASLIERSEYGIVLSKEGLDNFNLEARLEKLLLEDEILVDKVTKRKTSIVDIKPMIHELNIKEDEDNYYINCTLSSGSKKNLNPRLFLEAIFDLENFSLDEIAYNIGRKKLLVYYKNQWISPFDMLVEEAHE